MTVAQEERPDRLLLLDDVLNIYKKENLKETLFLNFRYLVLLVLIVYLCLDLNRFENLFNLVTGRAKDKKSIFNQRTEESSAVQYFQVSIFYIMYHLMLVDFFASSSFGVSNSEK